MATEVVAESVVGHNVAELPVKGALGVWELARAAVDLATAPVAKLPLRSILN
jgi:hypothetical protein